MAIPTIPNAPQTLLLAERRKAEAKYQRQIDRVFQEIEIALMGLATAEEISRALLRIASSPQFDELCRQAAGQMATMLAVGQKSTWRAAAAASSQGRRIYKALMKETTNTALGQTISDIVAQNARLIRTVPQSMAGKLSELARKREFEGVRPEAITREVMKKAKHLKEYEARRIARTESAKASTALVQARAESLELPFYIWRTARDQRVRRQHEKLNDVICRWSDPPDPEALAGQKSYGSYHPGGIFNCRCIALPIVDLEDIKFPAKVHISGHIETIQSLKAFRERFGIAA